MSYRTLGIGAFLLLCIGLVVQPSSAEVFQVTTTADVIPAPNGSLRAAIEASEDNGERDLIVFTIDGGTISLVAPLPNLLEGQLVIDGPQFAPSADVVATTGIVIEGSNSVERAIAILSANNRILGLDFVDFAGGEAILVLGPAARDNEIRGAVFRNNAGAGLRISPLQLPDGDPTRNEIEQSIFVGNGSGVVIEGNDAPGGDRPTTTIRGNFFGTSAAGGTGAGTGQAILVGGAAAVIESNRFSGPGFGLSLEAGSGNSVIADNQIGIHENAAGACSGFEDAAVDVTGSDRVRIEDNAILCSQIGISLAGTNAASVTSNTIGGDAPRGHRSHGILLDGASGTLIFGNAIAGNEGNGIAALPGPVVDPTEGNLISCNSITRNLLGAISLPGFVTSPPTLTQATPLAVEGQLPDVLAGWVEVFGDETDEAGLFQGAVPTGNTDPPFRHALPVLGMQLAKVANGAEILFDRSIPDNHTATLTDADSLETSELSDPLTAAAGGLVFDLIRGGVENLVLLPDGGIDLGDLVCLEAGILPDVGADPNFVDPDVPEPGEGFFYLSRRRVVLANLEGTYDPALCLAFLSSFPGPRVAGPGDCP